MIDRDTGSPRATNSQETDSPSAAPSAQQLSDLADSEKQAEYRREYLRQLRQRACPGCGDDAYIE